MNNLTRFVTGSKKAIYGGILTAVAWYIASQGWTLDTTIREIVEALPAGLVNGIVIWWTTNRAEAVNRRG